ncbi:hypothetical protein B0H14DRAFT_3426442, partial [Mycena olivaceomarginata]
MDPAFAAIPPTTHDIPHTDRLRMMRSMRKLTAVLGETPVRGGFFFHASASLSSLALPFQKSDAPHIPEPRPSLVLRVPDTFAPLPSPLSPGFSPTLMSPTSPLEEPDRRRQRLAKVSRTLGETVPPELIFTTNPQIKRRRRASTLVLPESMLELQTFAAAGALVDEDARTRRPALNGGAQALRRAISFILPDPTDAHADADTEDDATSPLGEVHVHPVPNLSPDTLSHPEAAWLRPTSRAFSVPAPEPDPEPVLSFAGAPPSYEESHQHGPRSESRMAPQPGETLHRQDGWTG